MGARAEPPRSAVTIRIAGLDDATTVADLAARTFRQAFETQNDPTDMAAYIATAFGGEQIRSELADPNATYLLAAIGDDPPTGYAKLRTGKTDASVRGPTPVEIERIYVEQRGIGTGIGSALMRRCFEEATARGHQTVWLGVWERNEHAIAFYRRWGFVAVGTHVFRLGSDDQTDLIMERPSVLADRVG